MHFSSAKVDSSSNVTCGPPQTTMTRGSSFLQYRASFVTLFIDCVAVAMPMIRGLSDSTRLFRSAGVVPFTMKSRQSTEKPLSRSTEVM